MEFAFLPISKIVLQKKGIVSPWLGKYPICKILSLRSVSIIPHIGYFVNHAETKKCNVDSRALITTYSKYFSFY